MGVAAHLGIDLREYDARIRTFIPSYDEMLDRAGGAVASFERRAPVVLDLGIGTGALASRVLAAVPGARIVGVDTDPSILAVAKRRLGPRLNGVVADFSRPRWTRALAAARFGAITASLSLHHIRTKHRKAALYRECFALLRRGGVLVSADCCLAAAPPLQREDRLFWRTHLERTYGRRGAERFLRAWAREDVYLPLEQEISIMRDAGFDVDVVWRLRSFAVVAGRR
jgi:SAM-dependent methyltransferase